MSVTSVRIKPEIEKPLEQLAAKLDRSKNYLINLALKEFLKRQAAEDIRWLETLDALESVKAGKGISESQVHSWLESWGTTEEKSSPGT